MSFYQNCRYKILSRDFPKLKRDCLNTIYVIFHSRSSQRGTVYQWKSEETTKLKTAIELVRDKGNLINGRFNGCKAPA